LIIISISFFTGGCACCSHPEGGDLILTHEDMMLKRRPYDPCPGEMVVHYK
jgi:hypothetical protein